MLPIIIIAVVAIIVVVVVLLLLLGGSSDDGGAGGIEDSWNINTMTVSTNIGGASVTTDVNEVITFGQNGTYTCTGTTYFSSSGTYSVSGSTITIDSLTWQYNLNGNSLTLEYTISYFGIESTTRYNCSRA